MGMKGQQKFTSEYQNTLLGNWIQGNHREDLKYLPACLFDNKTLYGKVEKGESLQELLLNGTIQTADVKELLEAGHYDVLYLTARKAAFEEKINQLHKKALAAIDEKDTRETDRLLQEIQETQTFLNEKQLIREAKGLADLFMGEIQNRATATPALYGFTDLDKETGGIRRKQLIVVGARPAVGKSAFTLQIADNIRKEGYKILYFPLEMTTFETLERLLVRSDLLKHDETKGKGIGEERKAAISEYLNKLEEAGTFKIYEGINKLEDIKDKIKQEKPFLVVIDQISQVRPEDKFIQIRDRYREITSTLKNIAITNDVAVLLVSQLNRDAVNKGASLEALAESDSIGQDADVVLLLEQEETQKGQPYRDITLKIEKQREGSSGKHISLTFVGEKYSFKNGDKTGFYNSTGIKTL